jgi:hypothetical protein
MFSFDNILSGLSSAFSGSNNNDTQIPVDGLPWLDEQKIPMNGNAFSGPTNNEFVQSLVDGNPDLNKLFSSLNNKKRSKNKTILEMDSDERRSALGRIGRGLAKHAGSSDNFFGIMNNALADYSLSQEKDAEDQQSLERSALKDTYNIYDKEDERKFNRDKFGKEFGLKERDFQSEDSYRKGQLGLSSKRLALDAREAGGRDNRSEVGKIIDELISRKIAKNPQEAFDIYKGLKNPPKEGKDPRKAFMEKLYTEQISGINGVQPDIVDDVVGRVYPEDNPAMSADSQTPVVGDRTQYDNLPAGTIYIDARTGRRKLKQ